MSTKKEVRAALKGKSGVNCFVRDSDVGKWELSVVVEVNTGRYGFETDYNNFSKCQLIPSEAEGSLIELGIVEDLNTPQLTPLQQALEDGRNVLCWVSDYEESPTAEDSVDLLSSYDKECSYPYNGESYWKYATPVGEEYFLEV